jgi:hypothetical protein
VKRLLPVLAAAAVVLLSPAPAHADCTTPELPVVGCVVPGATPTPEPPAPSPTPDVQTPAPTPTEAPAPTAAPAEVAVVPVAGLPAVEGVPSLAPVPLAPQVQQPVLVPRATPLRSVAATSLSLSPLPGVVASSFALVVFGLLALPLLLGFLAGLRSPTSGGTVNTHRTRLWTGLGVLGLAAVVGGVGWYRLSGEPLLNRQIPFLASAGIVVVLLSVLGGSLIIAEQLRGDQHRIGELEDAVRALTEALSPMVELPARRVEEPVSPNGRARSRRADAGST